MKPIRLGISACLLGRKVRYDGGHSLDRFVTDTLGPYVEFVPVCPEVECGFPVPRETLRLVGDPAAPRMVTSKTGVDHTDRMLGWADARVKELENENLCGFIFKSGSPSSGMERVKVYGAGGMPLKQGVGLFARTFMDRYPHLPVEDEGRLHDVRLRENFIERIFALSRWRELASEQRSRGRLTDFHTRHKLLVRAHSPRHHTELGRFTASVGQIPLKEAYAKYETLFMDALKVKSTVKKNSDVLFHIMGYFKKDISADEKRELLEVIDQYRRGLIPLIVPITLLNHYVRKYDEPYLKGQYYLNPHPLELKLRNHA